MIKKAYKFRLKTNDAIEQKLVIFAGHSRFVWNKARNSCMELLEQGSFVPRYFELCTWLKNWKKLDEHKFLNECHSQVLQQKLKDLDRAFQDAFDKQQFNKKMPKSKKRSFHSNFRYNQGFKIENRRVYLPKIGWVRFYKSCDILGEIKNITVSKKGAHWYISIQVEIEMINFDYPKSNSIIGIDMGVKYFAMPSSGKGFKIRSSIEKYENKLKIAQKRLSKKEKFSKNWKKQLKIVQRLHGVIANIRNDFLHWHSSRLCKNHAVIVMEDLEIKNMTKSAKGDINNPGKNVKAKSGLNKSILRAGWGEFSRLLAYKLKWKGGQLIKVSAKNTSLKCRKCNHIDKSNRKSQEKFLCVQCGHAENADRNAAHNILAAGHAVIACGDIANVSLQAQEPLVA